MRHSLMALTVLIALSPKQGFAAQLLEITVVRTSENVNSTTGELFVDGQFIAQTLELPWQNNQSYVSAIPTGRYAAHLRYDKPDGWRLQLDDVPGRSGVQLHIGNYPSQIAGCVLVGLAVNNAENRLEASSAAYGRLRTAFYGSSDPVQSPNKQVWVSIKHHPRTTELRASQGASWIYSGSGRWFYGPDRIEQSEYRRDMDWIYIKYHGPNFFMRFPIRGGRVSQFSSSQAGPWSDGESVITRVF